MQCEAESVRTRRAVQTLRWTHTTLQRPHDDAQLPKQLLLPRRRRSGDYRLLSRRYVLFCSLQSSLFALLYSQKRDPAHFYNVVLCFITICCHIEILQWFVNDGICRHVLCIYWKDSKNTLIDPGAACSRPQQPGEGTASLMRWYYNQNTRRCEQFTYSGLKGNENNFVSQVRMRFFYQLSSQAMFSTQQNLLFQDACSRVCREVTNPCIGQPATTPSGQIVFCR